MDTSIANQMGSVAFFIIELVGIIAVMSQVAWQVFVVFVPVFAACFWYQVPFPTLMFFSFSITSILLHKHFCSDTTSIRPGSCKG